MEARLYRDAILIQLVFFTVLDTLFSFTVLFPKKEQLSPIKAKHSAPILFVILIQFWLSDTIRVDDKLYRTTQIYNNFKFN